ncbi:DUF4132 domain-containing protein [Spirillospora sp. NBC_01491]|uniref:DUF4132 domain-containing protein n=1 Tax=Spirillospora sp. NBC_01491 TaxID=2976007 RepID=UPI002E332022|nr:DUF4132 domain-containing protein [Spirillospora sp. NBC_01491]
MSEHLPPLPDEDTLVIPTGWRRRTHPRRGGAPGPKIMLDAGAEKGLARFLDAARDDIERVLDGSGTDPGLVAAARAHLGGDPDPRGAAVLAVLTMQHWDAPLFDAGYVDAWASAHGVVFAACALVEMCGLDQSVGPGGGERSDTAVVPVEPGAQGTLIPDAALRVRSLLAAASDQEYAEAVERLAGLRALRPWQVVTAYLVPTRQDWVTELCAHPDRAPRSLLLSSLGSPEQLHLLGDWASLTRVDCHSPEVLRAFAEGVGPAVAPLMADALDRDRMLVRAVRRKALLEVLGVLPSDEAFRALVERRSNRHVSAELMKAMRRFPVRALRELAAAGASDLLEEHVHGNRALVDAALPTLPDAAREAVEQIIGSSTRVAEAAPDELPALLVEPPWARASKKAASVVVKGLTVPDGRAVRWDAGEQGRWAAEKVLYPSRLLGEEGGSRWGSPPVCERSPEWERHADDFAAGRLSGRRKLGVLAMGPDELVRPLLAGSSLNDPRNSTDEPAGWGRIFAARFELDALPVLYGHAKSDPRGCGPLLVPFLTAEVAALMADWLVRIKKGRRHAEAWLARHGADAVPLLVPDALGRPGPRRRAAEAALRHLADRLGRPAVVAEARVHGDEAVRAVEALLAAAPEDVVKVPQLAGWADPAVLPQILLNGRRRALPGTAVRHVLAVLAMSTPGEPHSGVDVLRESCDAASLTAFSWDLFERWREHGEDFADAWTLTALGLLGDDEVARRLAPIVHAWPGENGHTKAVKGVDILALIGSETALMMLDSIARKARFTALKEYAQRTIRRVADALGLSSEQLADRLVPTFGLGPDGGMTLDYGPRRFRVGFDEALRPQVSDEDGTQRKALPKPGAKDDPELAPAAHRAFGELKKNVRTVAADQIARLEQAMLTGRTWTLEEFGDLFVRHPLIWHIARSLVWTCDGVPFRLAEDRTFADVGDETLTPAAAAVIALPHPLNLGETRTAWSELFADYELIQPFPQLGRETHELAGEEREAVRLSRFEGVKVPFGRVLALTRRGWERGAILDSGVERWISRPVPGGLHLVVNLDPGIMAGFADDSAEQCLSSIWLGAWPDDADDADPPDAFPFARLDPVTASEILADLTGITQNAGA